MPNWADIVKNTIKVNSSSYDNVDQSARVKLSDVRYDAGVKTITFFGEVGSSSKPSTYSVQVAFKGVEPTQNLTPEEIEHGFNPKPSLAENEVLMRCNCPSYRFRFDNANRSNGAALGARFPVYHKKTDRAPLNPDNTPGACKHCIEFINYLQNQGFIF